MANQPLFSERELYMSSPVRLSVWRLSSVTFVHPTQAIEIFGNVSTPFSTLTTHWHPGKILRRLSQKNPSVGGVKHKRGSRILRFLANVNSSSGSLYVVVRPSVVCRLSVVCLSVICRLSSVVCNVRAPYSGDWNFRKCFYAIWYLGHPWPLCKNFTEIVRRRVKPKRGSKI